MALTIDNLKQFAEDNYELLRKNLGEQFQKHFELLLEAVPAIKSIEWTSSQEDEMLFELTYFKVLKNNGYTFEYHLYDQDNTPLSSEEFNAKEIELILGFQTYLDCLSNLIVTLWGSESFRLDDK